MGPRLGRMILTRSARSGSLPFACEYCFFDVPFLVLKGIHCHWTCCHIFLGSEKAKSRCADVACAGSSAGHFCQVSWTQALTGYLLVPYLAWGILGMTNNVNPGQDTQKKKKKPS